TQQLVGDPLTVKIWHAQKQSNIASISKSNPAAKKRNR
ncbi:MAG: hypothetical protein ACI9CO_001065, partial [Candidatus Azotimanducaceae bacterium]